MNATDPTLDTAYAARSAARTKCEASAAALARGQKFVSDATAKVHRFASTATATETEHARALEAALATGAPTELPAAPRREAGHAPGVAAARQDATLAMKVLASLQSSHAKAVVELAVAERNVEVAVDALRRAEIPGLIEKFNTKCTEIELLYVAIAPHIPSGFDRPRDFKCALSPSALRMFDIIKSPADPLHVPLNQLANPMMNSTDGAWIARRAALIAGPIKSAEAAA
jgi:hypothetical protein